MTLQPTFRPTAGASSQRPFDDDWRACLRAHYVHVVREVQDEKAPENNAITLRRVLIERAKFDEAEVDALYRQAVGAIEAHFVEAIDESVDDVIVEDANVVEALPAVVESTPSDEGTGLALSDEGIESPTQTENVEDASPLAQSRYEVEMRGADEVQEALSYSIEDTTSPVPTDLTPHLDIDSILASMDENALLSELSEDEENALMKAYDEGEATLTDVVEAVDLEEEAPTPPAEQPETTMPPESKPTQLTMF